MSDIWGPIISRELIGVGIFSAFFASIGWSSGHIEWLLLNGRELPNWISELFDQKAFKQPKYRNVFIKKGFAWGINIFAILWSLGPGRLSVAPSFEPIVGNIMLASIGGVVFELTLFFILTSFFRWVTRERRN